MNTTPDEARERITADRLVLAAAGLFRSRGYAAATTRELSTELGIQRASLYHHIRTKEDLLFEISVRALDHIIVETATAVEGLDAHDRLHAHVVAHMRTALRDIDLHATMLIELKHLSEDRRDVIVAKRREYEGKVESMLREQQAEGQIRDDLSARDLTLALLNLLNWTIFWYSEGGGQTPEEIAATLEAVFVDGARPRPV